MRRLWDRVLIWLKQQHAKFLPLPVSEIDFSRNRTESPRIAPAQEPWWDGEQWH